MREGLLVGLAEVDVDVLDFGEDEENVRLHVLGEALGREVLVYDGGDAGERAVHVLNYGDSAAAGRDDYRRVPEAFDGVELDYALRLRRGDDAPPAAARVFLHRPAFFFGHFLRVLGVVEASYRLRRLFKGGVVLIDDDLRHERDDGDVAVSVAQRVAKALLYLVADVALGHRAAAVEGDRGELVGLFGRRYFLLEHEASDLRAVAVDDGHFVAAAADVGEVLAGFLDDLELFLRGRRRAGLHQRVAAERYYYLRSVFVSFRM